MATRGPYDSPSPEQPRTVGERLRAIRLARGWTQEEMGHALNTDQTAVSAWERNKAKPSGAALAAISALLQVPLDSLDPDKDFCIPPPDASRRAFPAPFSVPEWPQDRTPPAHLLSLRAGTWIPAADLQEAMLKLIEASREGRHIWMITE